MICEFCHNIPQHPPCQACGGSGIAHCCDGPVGGPVDTINSPADKMEICQECGLPIVLCNSIALQNMAIEKFKRGKNKEAIKYSEDADRYYKRWKDECAKSS